MSRPREPLATDIDDELGAEASAEHQRPRRRFAQNFLIDRSVAERIVECCAVGPDENVLEIGPGRGALTEFLLGRGRELHGIELDRDLFSALRRRWPEFKLQQGDALRADFSQLLADGSWIVVGNLPYNISTPLLMRLMPHVKHVRRLVFMLQQEVVERICAPANTKEYGRLSVMLGYYCEARRLFSVSPQSFYPVPKVRSRIVELTPRPVPAPPSRFSEIVRRAFSQRRKTLRNALTGVIDAAGLQRLNIDPMRRAETLSVAEFLAIAAAVEQNASA